MASPKKKQLTLINKKMKKVYLGLTLLLASMVSVNAQSPFSTENIFPQAEVVPSSIIKQLPKSQSATERWYEYFDYKNRFNNKTTGGDVTLLRTYLFPDSLPLVGYGPSLAPTSYDRPFIHSFAVICDPTSIVFNDPLRVNSGELVIRPTDAYNLDSVYIFISYARYDQTSVDTLEITVSVNASEAALPTQAIGTASIVAPFTAKNPNTDTLFIKRVPYSQATNSMTLPAPIQIIKVPLDSLFHATDSTQTPGMPESALYNVARAVNLPINAGRYAVASVKFIPGYSYSNTDTLNFRKNYASIFAYEEFGPTGNMTGAPSEVPFIIERDYNIGNHATTQIKYETGWTIFAPTVLYGAGWQLENYLMGFKLSCTSCDAVSVNDIDGNISKLGLAYPNPAEIGESIIIPLSLAKGGDATVRIFNTIGQEVKVINSKDLNIGLNKINVNTANLNAGVYLYSLELDGTVTATQRFTLVR